jgi:hypothetical protein
MKRPGTPVLVLAASTTWPEMLVVAGMRKCRLVVKVAPLVKVSMGDWLKLATKLLLKSQKL